MAVDLGSVSNPVPQPPRLLFAHGFPQANAGEWDISARDKRLLLLDRTDAERPATEIRVVMNWAQELTQRFKQ